MAAYERNTGSQHPLAGGIITSIKRSVGNVPLTNNDNFMWYGTISIGTPAKDFKGVILFFFCSIWPSDLACTVDFDTGSSDLFVPSSTCGETCSGHEVYNPGDSSTSTDLGKPFSLSYGDGSTVSGEQYSDKVTIDGLEVR